MHTFLADSAIFATCGPLTRKIDSTRLGGSTVAKNPLQDFWAKRGGGRLFDMGGLTVIYGTALSIGELEIANLLATL